MDPLSITASAITVATLATQTCQVFCELRSLYRSLPGRLQALNNDVADFEAVLLQIASVFKERGSSISQQDQQAVWRLLTQAKTKLSELQLTVEGLARICRNTKNFPYQAYTWRKEKPKLRELQEDIHGIKCSLNVAIGASNSYVSLTKGLAEGSNGRHRRVA